MRIGARRKVSSENISIASSVKTRDLFVDRTAITFVFRYDVDIWDSIKNGDISKKDFLSRVPGASGIFCSLNDKVDKDVVEAAGTYSREPNTHWLSLENCLPTFNEVIQVGNIRWRAFIAES